MADKGVNINHTVSRMLNRPLVIASSGGGGHITAAKGIIHHLRSQGAEIVKHRAQSYNKRYSNTVLALLQSFLYLKSLPNMAPIGLCYESFHAEIQQLTQNAQNAPERDYLDLLLDLYSFGYEMAAIYNGLQRHDDVDSLISTVNQQAKNDALHYYFIKSRVLQVLTKQAATGAPFTSIISTQPQSLGAICDAVMQYNLFSDATIRIQQYLTDLPTQGATHFTSSLQRLTFEQRQLMDVYVLDIQHSVLDDWMNLNIIKIHPQQNPMVRPGFKNIKKLQSLCDVDAHHVLSFKSNDVWQSRAISKGSRVAVIMLGSLGGDAAASYLKPLLWHGYEHIFIFGVTKNRALEAQLSLLSWAEQCSIVVLAHQDDETIASILTRADCAIIRSGGLSTMELMALPLRPNKMLLIHHKNPKDPQQSLTSGLTWEDGNANCLMEYMRERGVETHKTCPKYCLRDLVAS